jgi:hypothetical protein
MIETSIVLFRIPGMARHIKRGWNFATRFLDRKMGDAKAVLPRQAA